MSDQPSTTSSSRVVRRTKARVERKPFFTRELLGRTLWDWLSLLLLPVVLIIIAIVVL